MCQDKSPFEGREYRIGVLRPPRSTALPCHWLITRPGVPSASHCSPWVVTEFGTVRSFVSTICLGFKVRKEGAEEQPITAPSDSEKAQPSLGICRGWFQDLLQISQTDGHSCPLVCPLNLWTLHPWVPPTQSIVGWIRRCRTHG